MFRRITSAATAITAVLLACGGETEEESFLHALDTTVSTESVIEFTPTSSLIAQADFTHPFAIRDVTAVQRFFERTPYNNRSFLTTYASNGVSAATGVLSAAVRHGINPIVLLTRLQMTRGLIGLTQYPDASHDVEYVFGCGCDGGGSCLTEMAGLDRQLDCLASRLRGYLMQIDATDPGSTEGGWGPGVESLTADNQTVTPPDKSTAVLYQYDPVYGEATKRGAWLFVHIYSRYASALNYQGTFAPEPSEDGAWIGDGCNGREDCANVATAPAECIDTPGGYCTAACDGPFGCPSGGNQPSTFCAQTGICVVYCNPAQPTCRDGYVCAEIDALDVDAPKQTGCVPE